MSQASLTRAPLEEVMLSMDVVDTMRHQQQLVDRELNAEARREALLARMREIYAAQGIEVSDEMLREGVRALEEERFEFKAPEPSSAVRLAEIYTTRGTWGKPVLLGLGLLLIVLLGYYLLVARPEATARNALPGKLDSNFEQIVKVSADPGATESARRLLENARSAMRDDDFDEAQALERNMRDMLQELERSYEVRIVARPNQLSGVWRVPANNPNARNY